MQRTIVLLFITIALVAFGCAVPSVVAQSGHVKKRKPNIVLINLDDCDVDLVSKENLKHYPNLEKFAANSLRFTNCHVTTPLCGPSRACLFRSQYAHNTGYRTNRANLDVGSGFNGGTQFFQDSGLSSDQMAVWMQDAGYHTMLVGKYFQGPTEHVIMPGWDRFVVLGGNRYIDNISRFDFFPDGRIIKSIRNGYRTDIETNETIDLLDEYDQKVDSKKPFFLYFAPVAPHTGPVTEEDPIPEKWKDRFVDAKLPSFPSFNEDDVSDKPRAYRDTLKISGKSLRFLKTAHRNRLVAMLGVDEMLQRLRKKIADIGQEQSTIVIVTADHGYLMGQHRMHGKSFPLIEATKVPLWIDWPGVTSSRNADQLLAHIDISATVAEIGGATLPEFVDGRSFAKLIHDETIREPDAIRKSVLVENWESRLNSVSKAKVVYSSMIKPDSMYTQWANGEAEYYDLNADPNQLQNRHEALSVEAKRSLEAELHSIRQNTCRDSGTTLALGFPTVNKRFVGPDIELSGFAEFSGQVDPVGVSIRRKETGEYWNGEDWQQEFAELQSKAPPVATMLQEWHLKPNLSEMKAGETLTVELHASNVNETSNTVRKLDVVFDSQPPKVTIRRPNNAKSYREFSNFGGFIEDDHGSEDVRLTIFDVANKKYYDGEQWFTERAWVSVLVNPKLGRWHARYPLPAGEYEVTATGKDSAGNWSEPGKPIRFLVDPASSK